MRNQAGMLLVLSVPLVTGACLQKDTGHTLYLSPDGAVAWTIDESGAFSDQQDAGQRFAEEQGYIGPALIGAHVAAQGLQALGPDGLVQTQVLRDQRPYHVVTTASFSRVDRALSRMFKDAGVRGTATLEALDHRTTLRIRFDFRKEWPERENAVTAMLKDVDNLSVVITDGKFIAGGGFDVPDRRRAVVSAEWLAAAEAAIEAHQEIELVLSWSVWE